MQEDDHIDEILTQHAIFKIMDHSIIPCSCGAYRKVIQNKKPDLLLTQCSKCGSQEPFNIADLALLGGGLLKLAIADGNNTELKPPNVTSKAAVTMPTISIATTSNSRRYRSRL